MSTAAPLQNTAAKSLIVSKSSHAGLLLQRKCACGGPASSSLSGECEECNKKRLQKKLSIGASNDPLEQEADRVADQVMAATLNSAVKAAPPRIQRFSGQSTGQADTAPASVDRVLASSGRPLDQALQQDMGQRFGHDFSQVRVHTGAAAEQSAQDVNAHAYTVGHNIVFGVERFSPESHEGRRLLAHELTHVVQQSGADGMNVGQSDDKRGLSPGKLIQRSCGPALGTPSPACDPGTSLPLGERFLFDVNCDDLKGGEPAHLAGFALRLTAGSTLTVHGFASIDGPAGFNMELSCHRGNKLAGLLNAARPDVTVVTPNLMHGATPGLAAENRSVIVETALAPRPTCGPDATDWFIDQVAAAKRDPAVLDIRRDLLVAQANAATVGLSSERIVEGAVLEKVLAEERRAGSPTRTPAASTQITAAGPGASEFSSAKGTAASEAVSTVLSPLFGTTTYPFATLALLRLRQAALNWKALVRTGARYDFKNDARTMKNPSSASCPVDCSGTITFCPISSADCFQTDVPGNLFYAHIGGLVGFTELALQLGSQFAQIDSTATWDPPEDTAMIALGFRLPDPLSSADLCSAVNSSRSIFTLRQCDTCSELTTAAIV